MRNHDVILTEYRADARNFQRGARIYDRTLEKQHRLTHDRLGRVDARWERSTRSILATRTALSGLTGFVGGAALIQLRNYAEQWRDVERRLQSIGVTGEAAQQSLIDLAIRTRSSVGGTAAAVQRLAKSTGDGIEITTRRVETLQKLLAAGGAGGSERASVSLQLGQALQSGVLSGDEFRSIRENAPVEFLDALARAAGVTRAELKGVAEDQRLTSAIVLEALDSLASTADARFGELAVSGEEAFAILNAGLVAYAGQVDESLGATAAINGAIASLGEYMAGAGEGAETMAAAIRVVGSVALATAGSRGLGAFYGAIRSVIDARKADVAGIREQVSASKAQLSASRELLAQRRLEKVAADERLRIAQADIRQRALQGNVTKTARLELERATRAQAKAIDALTGAQSRALASTRALTAAQKSLTAAQRAARLGMIAWTATMRVANGVMAFFGGPVGLAITGLTLLYAVMSQAKSPVERLDSALSSLSGRLGDLEGVNSSLASDYDALERAQGTLAEATRRGGDAAVDAATRDVAAINTRIRANEKLRRELALQARLRLRDARGELTAVKLQLTRDARGFLSGLALEERAKNFTLFQRVFNQGLEEFHRIQGMSTDELNAYIAAERERGEVILESGGGTEDLTEIQKFLVNELGASELKVSQLSAELEALVSPAALAAAALDGTAVSAIGLAAAAANAQAGVDGLIAAIPALNRAAKAQERVAEANENYQKALAGLNSENLPDGARIAREKELSDLRQQAISEATGEAEAIRKADEAQKDYLDRARVGAFDARGQALAREEAQYLKVAAALKEAGKSQEELARAEEAYQQRVGQINAQFDERAERSGSRGARRAAADAERDLASARALLLENGQKSLFIEQELNAERERLRELLPSLIALGLSRADAAAVLASELERIEEGLKRVKTASEEAAEAFAKGVLSDIRHADSLGDAIGRISDRLLDLALDPVFDHLAQQFANLAVGGGGGGGGGNILGSLIGALFNAKGNAFDSQGVAAFAQGDVFRRPTMFQYGRGKLGVMAEEKPEAVLPLERDSKGRLGVIAQLPRVPAIPAAALQTNSTFSWTGDMVIQSNSDEPQEIGREVTDQMRAMFIQMFGKQLYEAMRGGGVLDSTYQKKAGA